MRNSKEKQPGMTFGNLFEDFACSAIFHGHLFSFNGWQCMERGFESIFALAQCWEEECFS